MCRLTPVLFKIVFCTLLTGLTALTGSGQINNTERIGAEHSSNPIDKKGLQQLLDQSRQQMLHHQGDSAIQTVMEALRLSSRSGHHQGMDTTLAYLVNYCSHWNTTNARQAGILQQAITYVQPYKLQNIHLSWLYDMLASYYFAKGSYAKGLMGFEKALKAVPDEQSPGTMEMQIAIYTHIGSAWIDLGEKNKALAALEKADRIALQQTNMHRHMGILQNKGILYLNKEQFDSAHYYLQQAYELSNQYPDKHPLGCRCRQYTIANLAIVLIKQHRPDEALSLINPEISLLKQEDEQQERLGFAQSKTDALKAFYYFLQAYAHYEKKDYQKAEQILIPLLALVREEKIEKNEINIQELLAAIYDSTRQYQKAYFHKARYAALINSNSFKEEKSNILGLYYEIEKEKEISEKKWLIARQKSEIKEKNYLIAGSLAGTVLLATALIALYRNNRNRHQLQTASLTNLQQQQEIKQLQAKIEGEEQERSRIAHELHDGIVSQLLSLKLSVNALQMPVNKTILPHELNDVALQLNEATEDLRRTAHNLMPDLLLQQGLVLSVATLCEKISKSTSIEADFQAYGQFPKLPQETELTLYRMVQELVQNVLKHADATQLLVQLGYREELLSITIEDNGKGIPTTTLQPGNEGAGLRNIRRRVQLLNGDLDIESKQGKKTTVYLEFQLKYLI